MQRRVVGCNQPIKMAFLVGVFERGAHAWWRRCTARLAVSLCARHGRLTQHHPVAHRRRPFAEFAGILVNAIESAASRSPSAPAKHQVARCCHTEDNKTPDLARRRGRSGSRPHPRSSHLSSGAHSRPRETRTRTPAASEREHLGTRVALPSGPHLVALDNREFGIERPCTLVVLTTTPTLIGAIKSPTAHRAAKPSNDRYHHGTNQGYAAARYHTGAVHHDDSTIGKAEDGPKEYSELRQGSFVHDTDRWCSMWSILPPICTSRSGTRPPSTRGDYDAGE